MRRYLVFHLIAGLFFVANFSVAWGDEENVFGESKRSEAALMGMLYDLKQTQSREPTSIDARSYSDVVDEFLTKGWDETVLNRYYRVSKPLFTTQIFVPDMNADNAPRAFGAEKTVQPSRWIIHYKGQVSPPEPGTYRFLGCSDDIVAVAVDGKTELVGNRPDTILPTLKWKASEPDGAQAANDPLRHGDWFTVNAGEIIDLDVIIGERPGGGFNAFLMIEKQGETYEKDQAGFPILPIFQIAEYDTPVMRDLVREPLFAKGYPPWKCYQ